MNIVFLGGKVIETGKFKFKYGNNLEHKSMIEMRIVTNDNNVIELRGYDEIADEILRNEFKHVYIIGIMKTEGYVEIKNIEIN